MRSKEELLKDIDTTLDQLIQNAETIQAISTDSLFEEEICALQKTQQSLLAHLVHVDKHISRSAVSTAGRLEKKMHLYQELAQKLPRAQSEEDKKKRLVQKPRIGRNRKS